MKLFPLVLFLISTLFQAASCDTSAVKQESDLNVVQLTSRNFESEIADGSVYLVEFYAEWCG